MNLDPESIRDLLYEIFPPFYPGSYVTYRDSTYTLVGAPDDPTNGLVEDCTFQGGRWIFCLSNGVRLRGPQIIAVATMDRVTGEPRKSWLVSEYGLNGKGKGTRLLPVTIKPKDPVHGPEALWTRTCSQCEATTSLIFWHSLNQWLCPACRPVNASTLAVPAETPDAKFEQEAFAFFKAWNDLVFAKAAAGVANQEQRPPKPPRRTHPTVSRVDRPLQGLCRDMKRARITISTRRGPEEISALTVGPLAIHRTHPKAAIGWSISHVPSGASVLSQIESQTTAREVLRHLLIWEGCNWFAEKDPVPEHVRQDVIAYLRTVPRRYQRGPPD
jgi:hypothetical protein